MLRQTDSFSVSARVKNTGSSAADASVILYFDHHPVQTKKVPIGPGQQKEVHFHIRGSDCAPLTSIGIGDLSPLPVRILDPSRPPALDTGMLRQLKAALLLDFDHDNSDILRTPRYTQAGYGSVR